ncbi:MAG: response regulator transcription factor [Gemmatirosa sp.]
MRVLIIEDDRVLARLVERALGEAGYAVDVTRSAEEGRDRAMTSTYDAVLLDLELPDRNGLEVVRSLRREGHDVPVLIMTGRDDDQDIVRGLDAGADDYLLKPVSPEVLKARLRAAVRRGGSARARDQLVVGELALNRLARTVHGAGHGISLTPKEFAMLEHLMLRVEEVISRSELLEHVWNMKFDPGSNVVDAHVARLRQKLRGVTRPEIRTSRGVGFVLTMREA